MKIVLINGPTGSGKTTLSRLILKKVENGLALSTDDYYKTGIISNLLSLFVGCYFERNISFNSKLLKKDINFICNNKKFDHSYIYDFKKRVIKKYFIKTFGIKYLIIEGIFVNDLSTELKKYECLFIRINTNKESCMKRVINRDLNERGKSKNQAKKDFLKSWEFFHNKRRRIKSKKNEKVIIYSKREDIDLVIKEIIKLTT